ncbi:hypothetical protein HAX54_024208, partial [Datura stramonium]|nr:hypothetical protein [Datura stramonium]
VIMKKRRRSVGGRRKKSAYTSQEMGEKDQMFEQSALRDFGDNTGFDNTIEQSNIGGDTIEPIDIVPIACSGDTVPNNDKQQDISASTSDDTARRLSYEKRVEEGAEFCSKDKHLIEKEADGQSNQHIEKGEDYFLTPDLIEQSDLGVLVYERGSKRRKILFVTDDPISAESSLLFDKNDSSKEVVDPVTILEDQHIVIQEAQTQYDIVNTSQFDLAKSVEAFNNKVRDPVTSLEEQYPVIPEAQTQPHIVKSIQEVNKQVPELFTPIEEEHQVVHESHSYIEPGKSLQVVINDLQKEQQVQAVDQAGTIGAMLKAVSFTTDRPSYDDYVDEFKVIWKTKVDCGLFVLKFMKSIMEGESIEKCVINDIPQFRKNLATNLWRYSMWKIESGYETLEEKGDAD